jgi:tetratricopeptide (TPR) repeat protein
VRIKVFSLFILWLPLGVLGQSLNNSPIVTRDDLLKALSGAPQNSAQLLASHQDLISADLCDRLFTRGGQNADQPDYPTALRFYEAAKTCAVALGDQSRLGQILHKTGKIYYDQGELLKAHDTFSQAAAAATSAGAKEDLIYIYKDLSITYRDRGEYPRATEYIEQSLVLAKALHHQEGIAFHELVLGTILLLKGDYDPSLAALKNSLALFTELKNEKYIAVTLINLARNYVRHGNYSEAVSYYNKAMPLVGQQRQTQVAILTDLATLYGSQGDYDNMLVYFEKCLKVSQQYGYNWSVANSLIGIGFAYEHQHNYDLALEYFQKSLPIAQKIAAKSLVVLANSQIAAVHQHAGDYDLALDSYEKTLLLAKALDNKHHTAFILSDMARLYQSRGEYEKALDYAGRAAAIADQLNEPEALYSALTLAGRAHRALHNDEAASCEFKQAIEAVELGREQVMGGERSQEQFFERKVTPYYEMADILVRQGNVEQALDYAERAKGRALFDVLRSGRADVTEAMTAAELEQERKLNAELTDLNKKLMDSSRVAVPDQNELAKLRERLQVVRTAYETFRVTLYAAHPELKTKRAEFVPFNLKEARDLLPDANTALLEYAVGRDCTYLFVLTKAAGADSADWLASRDVDLRVYRLEIDAESLRAKVDLFRQRVAEGSQQYRPLARELYELLLRPAQRQLQGRSFLTLVPDSVLWSLPFQALTSTQNRYVIEDYALSYAPSLSVLRAMQENSSRRRPRTAAHSNAVTGNANQRGSAGLGLLAMGNPRLGNDEVVTNRTSLRGGTLEPLPSAEKEVEAIGELHSRTGNTKVFVRQWATEEKFKMLAPNARIIQFLPTECLTIEIRCTHIWFWQTPNSKMTAFLKPGR